MTQASTSALRRLFVCGRQAGTAHAFLPVIRALAERDRPMDIRVVGTGVAARIFNEAGLLDRKVEDFFDVGSLLDEEAPPDLILTGSSLEVEDDARYWHWSKENGVPSVAFVDSWVNYWQRFSTSPESRFDVLPDWVAVIDEVARRRMEEEGAPTERLVVAGDPRVAELRPKATGSDRIRERLGINRHHILLVFVCEPLSEAYDNAVESLGFDEWRALSVVVQGIERFARSDTRPVHLVLRPHPREAREKYAELLEGLEFSCMISAGKSLDRHLLCGAADAVLGMTSMLLYESTLLEVPAISVRPEHRTRNDLVEGHEAILCADTISEVEEAVRSAVGGRKNVAPVCRKVIHVDDFISSVCQAADVVDANVSN